IQLPGPDDSAWQAAVQALGERPFADRAALLLRDGAGRTFGAAITRLLLERLGPRGPIVIEPWARVEPPGGRRLHAHEIGDREERRLGLRRVAERLETLGMPAGGPVTNHLILFLTERGERRHVTCEGRRLVVEGSEEATSMTALLQQLRAEPGAFTPNVLLRPLIQNAIFPTVTARWARSEEHTSELQSRENLVC